MTQDQLETEVFRLSEQVADAQGLGEFADAGAAQTLKANLDSAQAALDDRSMLDVNDMAAKVRCHPKRFTRLVRLNYLAPDIIASIRDGTQPAEIDCRRLMSADLPMDWSMQRRLLGFPDQPDFLRSAPGW